MYPASCQGRGPRAAGWFADYLREKGVGENEIKSWKLEEGIKGWVGAGKEYTSFVDGFDEAVWKKD